MLRKYFVLLILTFVLLGQSVVSKDAFAQQSMQCEFLPTSQQINDCAVKAYQIINKKLVSFLAVVRLQLRIQEGEKALFNKAQNLWTQFRDTYCEFAAYRDKGQEGYIFYKNNCLAQLTTQRIENLQTYLENLDF
ncbi:lysozyme inhibitor LprI family protein [Candidatus Parabeggiatoa sp. HSG14]|uniref:lysozyme inhibitor LprI family protein n=1 Tax=Candidatus Parabeggiatoa sp. HSG14 TaxID=3055593 RepID=UPI0025A7369B|nr:lysozyme inhibitor LprI family protein [Thiotrichales bacterium HSG14]